MKLTRHTLSALILSALLISPTLTLAEESLWDKAKETSSKGWEATKEGASDAAEWTKEKADKAWQATREGTASAIAALKGEGDESAEEEHRNSRFF